MSRVDLGALGFSNLDLTLQLFNRILLMLEREGRGGEGEEVGTLSEGCKARTMAHLPTLNSRLYFAHSL